MLVDFADLLRRCLRPVDGAARYGGEEFVLVLRQTGAQSLSTVERIRSGWRTRHPCTTFSAGVAVHEVGRAPHTTLASADAALYTAKRTGRDRVCRYEGSRLPVG